MPKNASSRAAKRRRSPKQISRRGQGDAREPMYLVNGSRTTHVVLPLDEYERLMLADVAAEAEQILDDPGTRWTDYDDHRAAQAARRITAARKARGLTQQALAARVGMAQTQLSRIERRPDGTTLRTLKRLAAALGVNVRDLVD